MNTRTPRAKHAKFFALFRALNEKFGHPVENSGNLPTFAQPLSKFHLFFARILARFLPEFSISAEFGGAVCPPSPPRTPMELRWIPCGAEPQLSASICSSVNRALAMYNEINIINIIQTYAQTRPIAAPLHNPVPSLFSSFLPP